MAKPRVRYDDNDKPRHCDVRIPPVLAQFLYREVLDRGFRDETELVCHIIRIWSQDLDPMDWKKELKRLKDADAEAEQRRKSDAG